MGMCKETLFKVCLKFGANFYVKPFWYTLVFAILSPCANTKVLISHPFVSVHTDNLMSTCGRNY